MIMNERESRGEYQHFMVQTVRKNVKGVENVLGWVVEGPVLEL